MGFMPAVKLPVSGAGKCARVPVDAIVADARAELSVAQGGGDRARLVVRDGAVREMVRDADAIVGGSHPGPTGDLVDALGWPRPVRGVHKLLACHGCIWEAASFVAVGVD